ncbi:hypothetical protein BJY52DRAFT_1194794 [Lactarius psammicola]|nr:hypothetical protein BJY52DRAFT_1194794 [Lactarius psammicola]
MSSSSPSIVSFDSIVSDLQPLTVPELYGTAVTRTNSDLIIRSYDMIRAFLRAEMSRFWLTTPAVASIGSSFLAIPCTLPFSPPNLVQVTTKLLLLRDVQREDFEAFLSVFYPKDFEGRNLSHQQWALILHLSMRWGSASILKLALKSINPPTPHDQFMLAHPMWSTNGPTVAHQMGIWDVVLVAVREDTRSYILPIDGAEVTRIVEAALVGKLPRNDDDSASRASPEGGAAKNVTILR